MGSWQVSGRMDETQLSGFPVWSSEGGAIHLCIAGGSEPSLEEGSGNSEQTDEDEDLDAEAQAQPLNSKVSPPQALSVAPVAIPLWPILRPLSSQPLHTSGTCVSPLVPPHTHLGTSVPSVAAHPQHGLPPS